MANHKYNAAQSACFGAFALSIVGPIINSALTVGVSVLTVLSLAAVLYLVAYDVEQYCDGKSSTFTPLQHLGIATAALLLTFATPALTSIITPVMTLLAVVGIMMAEKLKGPKNCTDIARGSIGWLYKRNWTADLKKNVKTTFGIDLQS